METDMKMLAAVMFEQGLPSPYSKSQPFRIEEVELDSPGPGEVLVEIRAAGLCHSDLYAINGTQKRPLPIVGGHEGAGIVREIGPGVTDLIEGDHVVAVNVTGCGKCRFCVNNRPNLCQAIGSVRAEGKLATNTRRLRQSNGDQLNHYSGLSVFAQYAVIVADALVKIDKKVPLDVAALLGCGVITGAGAVFNSANVQSGNSVAIVGLGGVGLSAVMAAREVGASPIICLDVQPNKFALARTLGATHCYDARDPNVTQQVLDLTDGGVDFSFEISGAKPAIKLAHSLVVPGGEVVHVGVGDATGEIVAPQWPLVLEERVIRGSFMGGCVPSRDIPRYSELYMGGRFPMEKLRSNHIGFDHLNESLDLLERAEVIRQILLPHGTP